MARPKGSDSPQISCKEREAAIKKSQLFESRPKESIRPELVVEGQVVVDWKSSRQCLLESSKLTNEKQGFSKLEPINPTSQALLTANLFATVTVAWSATPSSAQKMTLALRTMLKEMMSAPG